MTYDGHEPAGRRAPLRIVIAGPLPDGDKALLQYFFRLIPVSDDSQRDAE